MHDFDSTANEIIDQITGETGWGRESSESELADNDSELAADLLGVSTEGELDQFLGSFLKKAARAGSSFLRTPTGQLLKSGLKSLAKKVLPMAGAAVGNWIAPGIGGAIGDKVATAAGSALGLELGGMGQDEIQEELAKGLLRTARQSAEQALNEVQAGADPQTAVTNALSSAVKRNLPGLASGSGDVGAVGRRSGRWIRRGNRIVLYNV